MSRTNLATVFVLLLSASPAYSQTASLFGNGETLTRTPPNAAYAPVPNGSDYSEGQELKANWLIDFDNRGNANAASFRVSMDMWDSYYDLDKTEINTVHLAQDSRVFVSHDIDCTAGDPQTTLMYNTLIYVGRVLPNNGIAFQFDDGTPYWEAQDVY